MYRGCASSRGCLGIWRVGKYAKVYCWWSGAFFDSRFTVKRRSGNGTWPWDLRRPWCLHACHFSNTAILLMSWRHCDASRTHSPLNTVSWYPNTRNDLKGIETFFVPKELPMRYCLHSSLSRFLFVRLYIHSPSGVPDYTGRICRFARNSVPDDRQKSSCRKWLYYSASFIKFDGNV